MQRGELTQKFLELAEDFIGSSADFVAAFLKAGYGASMAKQRYEFEKLQRKRYTVDKEQNFRRTYAKFIYWLNHEGFIEQKTGEVPRVTSRGKNWLKDFLERKKNRIEVPLYESSEANYFIIVAFDIPEAERKKRAWLRSVLKNLGLYMVQKSFWMGRVRLPDEFLKDLHKLHLIDHVEIFQVTKFGTLKHLI